MSGWHFIPWTLQYLVGGGFIIAVSVAIFIKNKTSLAYQSFFIYSVCTSGWLVMAFFHRNAPTAELSSIFFRIDLFLVLISFGFLPVFVFCLWGAKRRYFLLTLPVIIVGIYFLIKSPHTIFWSNYGWSYKFTSGFGKVFFSATFFSLFLFIGASIRLAWRVPSKTLVRKYNIALVGYLLFYTVAMILTSFLLQKYPRVPPLGGVLYFVQFMFIAYAAYLEPGKITSFSELKGPVSELAEAYTAYLNKFQATIPGAELGESIFRFQDYIEAMGLNEVVVPKEGKAVFDVERFDLEKIEETPDNIIRLVKELPWAPKAPGDLGMILERTYETINFISEYKVDEWLQKFCKEHTGFLSKNDLVSVISPRDHLPAIFDRFQPGRVYVFHEDIPLEAYGLLEDANGYNIHCLGVTKLPVDLVREQCHLPENSLIQIGFEKGEAAVTPADLSRLM